MVSLIVFAPPPPSDPLDIVDKNYGGGYIGIEATATVQEISLSDTQNDGLDIHITKIGVTSEEGALYADASDIASIRVWNDGGELNASTPVSSFPVVVCSGIDVVILDGGSDTLWVEVTVAGGAADGAILQLQTWVYYHEVPEGEYIGSAIDGAPETLDTTIPEDPSVATADPNKDTWTNDTSVDLTWNVGTDTGGSGVAGYSWVVDKAAGTVPDHTLEASLPTSITLDSGDGNYYIHVCTKDNAGNWTGTYHYGPWMLDTTKPTVIGVVPTSLTDIDVGDVSVVITFSEAMDITTKPSPTITGLETDPYTITDSSWSDGNTKWTGSFTLNDDNEEATGTYHVSGFKDGAGNEMLPDTSHTVNVDTTQASPDTAAVFRVTSEGNVYADGAYYGQEFYTGGADVAEWVDVSEPVAPGDVLELDPEHPGYYRKARGRCSTLVAGVVSTKPGFILGAETPSSLASDFGVSGVSPDSGLLTDDSRLLTPDSALLALIGIVPVKVTDEGGPIRPGDLLVVSSTLGCAMRWDADQESPCGFVGKALEPLTDPSGIILLLLMAH